MDTPSRDQQPARTDISGQNCWSERRIGDLNPGGCCHPTALAVPCLACQSGPAMAVTAQNCRPGRPERPALRRAWSEMPETFCAYGHAMATHGYAVFATLFDLTELHFRVVLGQLPTHLPSTLAGCVPGRDRGSWWSPGSRGFFTVPCLIRVGRLPTDPASRRQPLVSAWRGCRERSPWPWCHAAHRRSSDPRRGRRPGVGGRRRRLPRPGSARRPAGT